MARTKKAVREQLERAAEPFGLGPLDQLLTVRLSRVQVRLSRAFDAATAEHNLRRGAISSLGLIAANPGISQNQLTEHTTIDKSGIVAIIDALEDLGWAERKASKDDRRRHELYATAAGKARLKELANEIKKVENEMLAMMSSQEIEQLRVLLDRMFLSCMAFERGR